MSITRTEVVDNKVGDWKRAFDTIAAELNPAALRTQLELVIHTPIPEDPDGIMLYVQRMNASMALARLVSANDRAAATVAALLVAGGVKPTSFDYGDDT